MAYRPGMTVYTGNTIEIPGMGPNYTLKWKFTCNSKTYEDTIATGQSADTYKWRIPSSTFTPLFGLNVKGELHVYVYPNGSSTFGFGDYTYTLVLDPSIAPKIDYVRSSLTGKIYNNKAISLYTTISISFKVARVDGAMQTVKISDGRITYQMNVSQGSGYAEITQPFSTYTVPDDETNEYIDVNFSIDTIDARGRKASKTFIERVYKYVKPACKIRAVRNDDNTRISVYYEPVCQATVAEKANNITKIIGWIVTDDENNPQTLDLTNLASPQMLPGTVNSNESYMVRVAVIDSVELSNTAEIISQGNSPIMDIGRDGKTVTFFGSSPSSADEYSVQIGKKLYGKVIFNENNIKFNYNQVEMFHLGYDIFTDDDGTHAVKKFVFGDRNDVKGQLSSAIGVNNNVIGECGIALGSSNAVSGVCSSAIGRKLKASGDNQTVVGQYNIEDTENKYSFIVGNGISDNAQSNAFAVKSNGGAWSPTKVLWTGAYYMNGSQTVMLNEKISDQLNGVCLVWSHYNTSTHQASNSDVHVQFISKWCVQLMNGAGHAFTDPYRHIDKYFYVYDEKIVGNNVNGTNGTEGGISYDNRNCVLRAVIGV